MRDTVFLDNEDGTCVQRRTASLEAIEMLLNAQPSMNNGRSEWFWFRLPNGDAVFGCYPVGSTYVSLEREIP